MKELKDLKLKSLDKLKELSAPELKKELEACSKNLYVLKMKGKLGELKQTHLIKALRKYIARLNTLANAK